MQRANKLFGKEIVEQATGEKQGTVRDLVLDSEALSIVALLVGGMIGRDRVVRWDSVVSVGDVVVIGNEAPLVKLGDDPKVADLREKGHQVTGTEIITEEGEKIGTVSDLFVDDRGEVVGYEVKGGTISDLRGRKFLPMEKVRAAGKDAIIASDPDLPPLKDAEEE